MANRLLVSTVIATATIRRMARPGLAVCIAALLTASCTGSGDVKGPTSVPPSPGTSAATSQTSPTTVSLPPAGPDRNAAVDFEDPLGEKVHSVAYLDQNWSPSDSQRFYFTEQGSQILPYSWFLALEQAGNTTLFRDNANMNRFRYLAQKPDTMNPDGLPVGFVKSTVSGRDWLGLTCAACHTAQIDYQDVGYRIDGGAAMSDVDGFQRELTDALKATLDNDEKLNRFVDRIRASESKANNIQVVRDQMKLVIEAREGYIARNTPPGGSAGYGRIDALGAIMNEVYYRALLPADRITSTANAKPADAPVSIPVLWDTPQHDRVQWIGAATNGGILKLGNLGRNVGEVLGVFGDFTFENSGLPGYRSSVNVVNLHKLDDWLVTLWSPQWPSKFPPLDQTKVAAGSKIYAQNCLKCHALIDRKDPARRIIANMSDAGTDTRTSDNFFNRTGRTGMLEGRSIKVFPSLNRFGSEAGSGAILGHAVIGTILGSPFGAPEDQLTRIELDKRDEVRAIGGAEYKARPLNGIWASAPYLHNGSVPSLFDLLHPADQRPASFHVGSRQFDPTKVGFKTDDPAFPEFHTRDAAGKPIPGNSNAGHEYGMDLSDDESWALIEYLKNL